MTSSIPRFALTLATLAALVTLPATSADDKLDPARDVTRSPFGIGSCHIHNVSAKNNSRWLPQITAIGVKSHRTAATSWNAIEPAQGKWAFDELDKQMTYLEEQGVAFGGIFYGNPKWSANGTKGLPVNNLEGWSKYCYETVKHAKGRIKYWEVWNEPPNGTGKEQTAADYAKIVVAAHDAAKKADPTCLVGMAAQSVNLNYLDQAIKAGAKGHFDYITLHPYEVAGMTLRRPGSESVYLQIAATTRKMLAAQDPDRVHCPILFTEIGCAAGPTPQGYIGGLDLQAEAVVKYYAMGLAQGIACIHWFEGMDGDSGPMGLMSLKGEKRPAYTALAQLVKHLGQRPTYLGWTLLNDKHYAFIFQGPAGPVMATWAATKTPDTIDFGRPVRIIDPKTGDATEAATVKLTTFPILVTDVPAPLVKQAQDNKAKPFPWGGDFTGAKSVSITLGEKTIEKGLHTHSADSIAADVLAYGGSARVGNVPGGNVFMVDPNFLSYTTVPIEIRVVCRRNAANDPAKLTLEYESTTGFKKAAPYDIPDNTQWHTATWRIDDPQFVSKWAFNFRLNSGKYAVQSVIVTRLD